MADDLASARRLRTPGPMPGRADIADLGPRGFIRTALGPASCARRS